MPDFEAWRFSTPDLPLNHVETRGVLTPQPAGLKRFTECLEFAHLVHAKLLRLDSTGSDPHFPLGQLMEAIRESSASHRIVVEYEGWIPDIDPHLDCVAETRRCVDLVRRSLLPATTAPA